MAINPIQKNKASTNDILFSWSGKDKNGKVIQGDLRAKTDAIVSATLRRQGITNIKVKKKTKGGGQRITEKDITLFTRQLATMMKAGVPLLQSFDIVSKGAANPTLAKLIQDIRMDVETGTSLSQAFRKFPIYFDSLFCNLINAGEQAGILEDLLSRLAVYKEKTLALKGKIKSAMVYPASILGVAFLVTTVIMLKVIPAFKEIFSTFGADLPAATLIVIAISNFFVNYWWLIFGSLFGGIYAFFYTLKRSESLKRSVDITLLKIPVIGSLVRKATIARWTRTLATMFTAGVPLVDSLESVAGASGNAVYFDATKKIQTEVNTGTSLTTAMQNSGVFPNMTIQMVSIGEESGSLSQMLEKVADFYEQEVDDAVAGLSSLMEPVIMVILGVVIGGLVIAMYLPIFKMGGMA